MANEFKLSYTASQINEKLGSIENLAKKSEIPSKLSELTNDSDFATEGYVNNAVANIDIPEVDLSNYALKSEIPTDYLTEVPAEYVTESELNAKGYLTEHQSLAGLATETFVNQGLAGKQPVGDYALKSEIPTNYLTAVPAEYVTEYELNSKGYLTEQSLQGLATETYVNNAVANLVNSAPDALNTLDELAAALGDDENFATTVTNQIAEKVGKTELTTEVNSALAAAKESGEFDGADGYTPVKGTDYWTEADKAEMVETVRSSIPTFNLTEMGLPLVPIDGTSVAANMDCTAIRNALETGPIKSVFNISLNGHSTPFTSVACGLYLSSDDCWQVSSVATMIYGGNPVTMVGTFNVRTDKITVNMYTIAYRSDIQSYIDSSILGGEW